MPDIQTKIQNIEKDITNLQKDFIGINYTISYHSKILRDMKNILEKQSKILEKTITLEKDMENFKREFYERKEVTDSHNKKFFDFISRAKGGLLVGIFLFGIIQLFAGHTIYKSSATLNETHKTTLENKIEIEKMKAEDKVYKEYTNKK